ncbi:hypothetical protein GCM10017688_32550 [Streptomyces ramulosus]
MRRTTTTSSATADDWKTSSKASGYSIAASSAIRDASGDFHGLAPRAAAPDEAAPLRPRPRTGAPGREAVSVS